jgi:hypothetical protein
MVRLTGTVCLREGASMPYLYKITEIEETDE